MKRSTYIVIMFLASAMAAVSHPLGNFSVNQYSRIEVNRESVDIRQIVDMAEIPTFLESKKIDTDSDGKLSNDELENYFAQFSPGYISNLHLDVDGGAAGLSLVSHQIQLEAGAGDLSIMKIYLDLTAKISAGSQVKNADFQNLNFPDRIGWNEMFVRHSAGVNIFNSTAFGNAVTEELKSYPTESLSSPLAERSAQFSFIGGRMPDGTSPLMNRGGSASPAVQKDRFAELISVSEITPAVVIVGLLLAFGLGAMHAMSPGHGKTVVGAYLVGSKGTPKHAAFLGMTVTVTHTLAVFALGLFTLLASNYVLPERVMPMLGFLSGCLVLLIGLSMFKQRLLAALGWNVEHTHHHHHHDDHVHEHHHDHSDHHEHTHDGHTHSHGGHTHTHLPPSDLSWRTLLALGISGGLLPCPSALVLMLAAISLGRVGYGLILTTAFSLGLAATLTTIGLAFLYVGKIFNRPALAQNRIIKTLPVFSSLVISVLGAAICYNSVA